MPTSSRLDLLFGTGTALRCEIPLTSQVPDAEVSWLPIWENGMYGGHLTAATDPANARVRVDLYWPGVREAEIYRVHADATEYLVRGGDPATMCTAWARWDYEVPLDQAVYYRAVSSDRDGSEVATSTVTVASSTEAWLKHPTQPALNRIATIRALSARGRAARRSVLRPPLRRHGITVHGVASGHAGQIVLQVQDTDELDELNELLDDGAQLLLSLPDAWGGHHWWISVDRTQEDRLEPMLGSLQLEHVTVSFEVEDRADGEAAGGATDSYEDVADTYQTYNHIQASGLTYIELSMLD